MTAGTPLSLLRTRSAAAAASSAMAITVASSSRPCGVSRDRASRRAARSPAQPIATSAWPRRQARPKLSAITTAGPAGRTRRASLARGSARGRGVGVLRQQADRVLLGEVGGCRCRRWRRRSRAVVSAIRTPRSARSTSAALVEDQLRPGAGPCPSTAASCAPRRPAITDGEAADAALGLRDDLLRDRRRRRPSASDRRRAAAISRRARRPPRPRAGPATGDDLQPASPPRSVRRAPSRVARRRRGRASSSRVRATRSAGRVEVERQRRQLLDRTAPRPRARAVDVAGAAALAEGRARSRPAGASSERVGAGAVAVRDDRDVARRASGQQPSSSSRGSSSGQSPGSRTTRLGAELQGAGDPGRAPPPSGRARPGREDLVGAGAARVRARSARRLAGDDDRALDRLAPRRSPPARPRASPLTSAARSRARRCRRASRCLAAPKRLTGRIAVAFKPRRG